MRMQVLEAQVDRERNSLYAAMVREQDERNKEILEDLWAGRDMEKEWHEQLQNRWGCSPEEIQNRILSVLKTYHLTQSGDRLMWDAYHNYSQSHRIQVYDLMDFDWYRAFWREPRFRVGRNISVAAHNGVRCSDAEILTKTGYEGRTQAILLLKDGYRPELDVSRTKLHRLPLAADLELAMLRREWKLERFYFYKEELWETEYWRIPGSRYLEVMDEHPQLEERLRVKTDHGAVSLQEIPALLRRFPEIRLWNRPVLCDSIGYSTKRFLYEYGILACLRRDHTLLGRDGSLWLRPATGDPSRDWEEFPPSFFLPVEGVNGKLAERFASGRYYCNEAHPLSGFLIRNRPWLEAHTPGLLREIMESLAKDNREELIPRVNQCLQYLQEYPGDKPQVPEGAFLTEADLW